MVYVGTGLVLDSFEPAWVAAGLLAVIVTAGIGLMLFLMEQQGRELRTAKHRLDHAAHRLDLAEAQLELLRNEIDEHEVWAQLVRHAHIPVPTDDQEPDA